MNRLNEAERVLGLDVSASMPGRWYAEEVVEAIIESRLASVEALADKWADGPYLDLRGAAITLRAVLGSDAEEEGAS